MFKAAVLTVSDRSFRGERPDAGGPLVVEILKNAGYTVTETAIVPDEKGRIEAALRQWCDREPVDLIVTTGGTGFAPRDVTPEATLAVCDRLTPGIPEAMRYASMQVTNRAMLSRAAAGIRKGTLIVNLPGSPKAARENLEAVLPALAHGLEMLSGRPAAFCHSVCGGSGRSPLFLQFLPHQIRQGEAVYIFVHGRIQARPEVQGRADAAPLAGVLLRLQAGHRG